MFSHNYLPHPGGLEVMVWSIARRLAMRHDVVLVTSAYAGRSGVSHEDGMEVHRLPALHGSESLSVPYPVPTGRGLRAALAAADGASVVHAHGALYLQTQMGRHIAARSRAPMVLTEHVGFVEYRRALLNAVQGLAWRLIGDRVVRRADAVVACSGRVQRWLADRSGHDIRYVPNAVDLERFRPRATAERAAGRRSFNLPEHEPLVLFVGRESAKKNLEVVLRGPRANHTLVVCGGNRSLAGERIIDLGIVPYQRMPELFGCVDVVAHPASGEGFPLAVLEAVASGIPVVLLWDEGYAPVLPRRYVIACDDPSEIGRQVAALIADEPTRHGLAIEGRRWAERHWSWDAAAAAYEEIYSDVIERAHKS